MGVRRAAHARRRPLPRLTRPQERLAAEIRDALLEEDDGKKKMTKADLARWDENNRRLLALAQKAQAELDRRKQQAESG